MQNFKASIVVFHQCGPALDPVAVVAIKSAIDHAHLGTVDVATQDPVMATALGLFGDRHLKVGHVIQGALDLLLEVCRE